MKKRFLRDGVLEEMICTIRAWDRKLWTKKTLNFHNLPIFVQLFETNKLVLSRLEQEIDHNRCLGKEEIDCLIESANLLKMGLTNAYEGMYDVWRNYLTC